VEKCLTFCPNPYYIFILGVTIFCIVTVLLFFGGGFMQQNVVVEKSGEDFKSAKGKGVVDFDRIRERLFAGCYADRALALLFTSFTGIGEVPVLGRIPSIRGVRLVLPDGRTADLKAGLVQRIDWK